MADVDIVRSIHDHRVIFCPKNEKAADVLWQETRTNPSVFTRLVQRRGEVPSYPLGGFSVWRNNAKELTRKLLFRHRIDVEDHASL